MTRPIMPPAAHAAAAILKTANAARLAKAAEDFTAQALSEMLKPMFGTTDDIGGDDGKGPFDGGPGEKTWKPMMVDEIAKSIARQGSLGLSGPVTQAMLQLQEKAK